jgi:hypothetical protein
MTTRLIIYQKLNNLKDQEKALEAKRIPKAMDSYKLILQSTNSQTPIKTAMNNKTITILYRILILLLNFYFIDY